MEELKKVKKSNRVSVRLRRAIKELTDKGNHFNVGCAILEDIIVQGIKAQNKVLENRDSKGDYFISSHIYEETFKIIKKHLNG